MFLGKEIALKEILSVKRNLAGGMLKSSIEPSEVAIHSGVCTKQTPSIIVIRTKQGESTFPYGEDIAIGSVLTSSIEVLECA